MKSEARHKHGSLKDGLLPLRKIYAANKAGDGIVHSTAEDAESRGE